MGFTRWRVAAALALSLAATGAHATNGMRMSAFGPVQEGMGGVGVGATLDSAALVTNPAGLATLDRRLDLGGTFFKPTVSYQATGISPGFVANDGANQKSDRGPSFIPALGLVVPLGGGFTAGIGAYGTAGMGVDYPTNLYYGVTYTSYQQLRVTPAIAYRFGDVASVGVTFNAMWAQMKYDVASGVGQVAHDTANSFGAGATIGVQVTPVKTVTLGAAYETKSRFQDFSFDVPAHTLPSTLPPPYGGMTMPAGTDKLSFDQPSSFTAGVGVTPIDGLLLAADVQWIRWSETNGANQPVLTSTTGAMPFNLDWTDQWVFKIGAQWQASKMFTIRAGYDYGKSPLKPDRAFENIAFPAVAEQHFALGLGIRATPALSVELAAMYSPEAKLSGANAGVPAMMGGTGGQGIQSYQTKMSQLVADAGLTYRF
jgi:long-chain fatty acid transport protein